MDPYIAQALAQAHVDDLHREAARRRLARSARAGRPRHTSRGAGGLGTTLRTAASRLTTPVALARREPGCCPA